MSEIKGKVEALLFAVGKKIELEEIARICKEPDVKAVETALQEIKKDYEERQSPLLVISEGTAWKLTVRELYLPLVKNIVAETELSKSILETLAVIAWKQPVKQSEVINMRTNKAYEHIQELEELGFVSRAPHGRTMLIKLTEKFFNYFELSGDKDIRDVFKAIGIKSPEQLKVDEFQGASGKRLGELQVYQEPPASSDAATPQDPQESDEQLGNLEVFEEPAAPQQVTAPLPVPSAEKKGKGKRHTASAPETSKESEPPSHDDSEQGKQSVPE